MFQYNPAKIESKWQKIWQVSDWSRAKDSARKPKFYCLVEFPYPSGSGLHVGHLRSYSALDAVSRYKRMNGFNVLYPMGWDAFGLPAENYAIKTGVQPRITTRQNIANYKKQMTKMGLSFDWSREVNTTDPRYYKWTQWIFLQLFKKGLAYQKEMPVNWCPACKIGLANEEVIVGKCERCGAVTEKKNLKQWMLKITAYADRLLKDLDIVDYSPRIREQQINWIGRSEGAEIEFRIKNEELRIKVFTTRPDTIFGATYLVVCPEHALLKNQESRIKNKAEIEKYTKESAAKSDLERTDLAKEKTGVNLEGISAINPANNKEIPIFVADYVLPHYGTGAIMAVPAHDQRDSDFALKYNLPIIKVVQDVHDKQNQISNIKNQNDKSKFKNDDVIPNPALVYEDEGVLINSAQFNGLNSGKASNEIVKWLSQKSLAKKAVNYKLRDWVFSRQHYWGEPIPLVFCPACKKQAEKSNIKNQISKLNVGELANPGWIAVSEKDLPIKLPSLKKYQPTGTGESPLASATKWVNTKCPKCGGPAKRETDTMPNWAGSSWYFLRYCDSKNDKKLADPKKLKYWLPVDLYNGGMEHTTLHLLYSRFWHKFLFDIGVVPTKEPYAKRRSHGVVLAQDLQKMSKSRGSVVNPDEMIKIYGADSLRVYEMFMGPFSQMIPWSTQGLVGVRRFLERVWLLGNRLEGAEQKIKNQKSKIKITNQNLKIDQTQIAPDDNKLLTLLHQTIKKIGEDLEAMRFNTVVAALMILTNKLSESSEVHLKKYYETLLILLAPFAPHIVEELWQKLGHEKSIFLEKWPQYNPKLIKQNSFDLVIQINGKLRDRAKAEIGITQQQAESLARASKKIQQFLSGKQIKKVIFVKDKLINLVV